jgi:hypothetical protein
MIDKNERGSSYFLAKTSIKTRDSYSYRKTDNQHSEIMY